MTQAQRLAPSLWSHPLPSGIDVRKFLEIANHAPHPGIGEVTVCFDEIGIYGQPAPGWEGWLHQLLEQSRGPQSGEVHEIKVDFDSGLDWDRVCERTAMSRDEAIQALCESELICRAVGFMLGFSYLQGVPGALAAVPRLPSPRRRVLKGALGLAEDCCGIYPSDSPGGWNLIGQVDIEMVGPAGPRIQVGDRVRFTA